MTQDASVRSKPQELFGKMHLGLDHVLAKLLLEAPPLPDSLKLQTETQSLATTWVQVTEAFEKRKGMLQRRKEKTKNKNKRREEVPVKKKKVKEKDKIKQKSKSRSSSASPRTGKNSPREKKEKKKNDAVKKEQPNSYEKSILKKLRKQPMCENVEFGTNKYKALVKWMEVDKGKDEGTSPQLTQLLSRLQLETTLEKKNKTKLGLKRSLESLDETLRAEKREKRKADRRRSRKRPIVDEDEVVYESGEEEEEPEYKEGYSDSDEAEFVPELENSPPPEKPKKRGGRAVKRQKQEVEGQEALAVSSAAAEKSSRDHLAAVVAKIRADDVASGKDDAKYLSYERKAETVKPGASSKSAIVLDDSDEEEEEEEEEEDDVEEETKEEQEQDSSTDEDNDMFDLNEADVYVVEAILCVKEGRSLLSAGRRQKEADLYLVKWEGYNELTWEPDENIPRRLIAMFRERERAKRACNYQIKVAHERREVINVTTQAKEIIYMVQWINQEMPVWESRTTLPIKTQVWLDKVLGAPATKNRRETKVAKQYIYQ